MDNEDILRGLSFIRYMYDLGLEQSKQPEPLSSVSVLIFHDSVELFLQLVCVANNTNIKDIVFMGYWEEIEKKTNLVLTQKETMRKLNDARVQLKHKGVMPSKSLIESARHDVNNFFLENTLSSFNIQFESISMANFVKCEPARKNIEEADTLLGESKLDEAVKKISLAFEQIIDDYEKRKVVEYGGRSPFSSLQKFTGGSRSTFNEQRRMEKIQMMGLDYNKYTNFRLLVPRYSKDITGQYFYDVPPRNNKPLTIEDCRFCYNFVVESALHVQRFD
jgi:hypothetical protein